MDQTTKLQRPEQEAAQPSPEVETTEVTPESPKDTSAEAEGVETPEAPRETVSEMGSDAASQNVEEKTGEVKNEKIAQPTENINPHADITEPTPATDLDKTFVKAADGIIDQYEGKPYEEEEEHHKLQAKYLWQRFKRVLRIGDK